MEGQWVLHWNCRRCGAETTVILQLPLTRHMAVPTAELHCQKCQHPHAYGSMRAGNKIREDFAFICECECSVPIPYKAITLGPDLETGNFIVNMPEKVTCTFCKKEKEVPA